jgi:prepilin-type N-terminal cleavage/methylation domain-containing protein/prepilin-type processing-associated H-X9-DG protein
MGPNTLRREVKVKRKGFTLIELLVVIAIIAVLAAILFPVFAKAQEKARQSTCASNMKQLTTAITTYSNDYDGMFPPVFFSKDPAYTKWNSSKVSTTYEGHTNWCQLIDQYVKSKAVFTCPDDGDDTGNECIVDPNDFTLDANGNGTIKSGVTPTTLSYVLNTFVCAFDGINSGNMFDGGTVGITPVNGGIAQTPKMASIAWPAGDPSKTYESPNDRRAYQCCKSTTVSDPGNTFIMWCGYNYEWLGTDSGSVSGYSSSNVGPYSADLGTGHASTSHYWGLVDATIEDFASGKSTKYDVTQWSMCRVRPGVSTDQKHNGGTNYAFCDGHVKWFAASQVLCNTTTVDQRFFNEPDNGGSRL